MSTFWHRPLLATVLAACGLGAGAARAAHDDVILLSNRDSVFEVWAMGLDGSRPLRLVPKGGSVSEAHWSPLGDRIAYVATVGPHAHIFMHERATGQVRQLTSGPHVNSELRFSPDGRQLAFTSNRDGNLEIYTMRIDGSAQQRLTTFDEDDTTPVWSPDGRHIAFLRNQDRRDVWVMRADGSEARNLTSTPKVDDVEPVWSPDGSRVLYGTRRNDAVTISSVALDGTDRKTLVANKAFNHSLVFSPDGRQLVWVSNTGGAGTSSLWLADADGSGARALTQSTREDLNPAWSRDGQRVFFASTRTVRPAIFSVARDGTDLQQLTWATGQDLQPRVRPSPGARVADAGTPGR